MNFAHRSRALAHGLLWALWAVSLPSSAAEGPAGVQRLPRCEAPKLAHDKLTVVCALDDTAAPQSIHIKVHFTGSHDDTTASLAVVIGDMPVACDPGSKTSTESEDGDVTLDCRFTVPGATKALRASAKWFHAQYTGVEVNGRRP